MIRRGIAVLAAAATAFALLAPSASADAPAGPRLVFAKAVGTIFQVVSSDPNGNDQRVLAGGGKGARPVPNPFSPPTWSGNGALVAFSGLSHFDGGDLNVYRVGADGNGLRKVAGTKDGFRPVLSPDGGKLAFAVLRQRQKMGANGKEVVTFDAASTWVANLGGGQPKRITPWKNGLYEYPSSFSPDGRSLGLSVTQRVSKHGSRDSAVVVRVNGSGAKVLAKNATSPVFSPDGTRVALVLNGKAKTYRGPKGSTTTIVPSDLAIGAADGSGLRRITDTKDLELLPSWDPSGERLVYTQQRASGKPSDAIGVGDAIMQINADGSCRTKILSSPGVILYGASWQPGPGREAGRIAC